MQKVMLCGALLAAAAVASPAQAEISVAPGLWQQVETGTEDGKPAAPVTYTNCVTPEEAKDPIKAMANLKAMGLLVGQYCKKLDVDQKDQSVALSFACGDEKSTFVGMTLNFTFLDARHFSGTIKSRLVFSGKETTSDKAIEGKWLQAACKKDKKE